MNEIVKQIKSKLNLSNQIDEENLINSNENSIRESEIDIKDDFGFKCKCEGDWCDCDTIQFLKESKAIGFYKKLEDGNILLSGAGHFGPKITDIGLSQLINDSSSSTSTNVFGVLPYIASELLDKKPFSFASDVYSFGIIMVEVSTGKLPYGDVPHDERLALAICNGLRPRVTKGTPKSFIDLVDKCLDADPEKRPSTQDLSKVINVPESQLTDLLISI
ncbi:6685_t:CDS:2 [Funneliformis geosporum]|uniref:6685_t:CDS:1 n=1 Tax=Funneliformis geosporum TaxID=1117311 RepID=A0A9W4SVI5_9GLOM|nr:6685_t:CDS:2 [Funneliformis geosporum]